MGCLFDPIGCFQSGLDSLLASVPWLWVLPAMIVGAFLGKLGTSLLVALIVGVRFIPDHPHEHVAGIDATPPPVKPPARKPAPQAKAPSLIERLTGRPD